MGVSLLGTLALVVVFSLGGSDTPEAEKSTLQKAADLIVQPNADDELAKRAAEGDREALTQLQQRPDGDRNLRDWRALGSGHARIKDYSTSIAAYAHAVKLDPSSAEDPKQTAPAAATTWNAWS